MTWRRENEAEEEQEEEGGGDEEKRKTHSEQILTCTRVQSVQNVIMTIVMRLIFNSTYNSQPFVHWNIDISRQIDRYIDRKRMEEREKMIKEQVEWGIRRWKWNEIATIIYTQWKWLMSGYIGSNN